MCSPCSGGRAGWGGLLVELRGHGDQRQGVAVSYVDPGEVVVRLYLGIAGELAGELDRRPFRVPR